MRSFEKCLMSVSRGGNVGDRSKNGGCEVVFG
jgi:hypothetical protein